MTRPPVDRRNQRLTPAIPEVNDRNLLEVAKKIKMAVDAREGRLGSALDAFVSFRDLVRLGLGRAKLGVVGKDSDVVVGDKDLPVDPLPYFRPKMYDGSQDQTPPPRPTDLVTSTVGSCVVLTWKIREYPNHMYFEVWRGTANSLKDATLIGTPVGTMFQDPTGTSAAYLYWVRARTQARVLSNPNATAGTPV